MMSMLRFFALGLSSVSLTTLVACGNQTNRIDSASTPAPTTQTSTSEHQTGHSGKAKININTAILSELDKLEAQLGVPALSHRIQASRPYGSVEELVSKQVVNQAQFDQIKELVTIEDVVLTGEAKDVDYLIKLGLMKGHLLVARELLDLQKPDQAEPHIGHPVEEIYADVEDQFNQRNVQEFKSTLIALQDRVKAGAKDTDKVNTEFKASLQAVDGAIAKLPETQRQSPSFVLQVINGLLDTANAEYTAAIANGKITEAIEYQDSRGFVIYANQLYSTISSQMAKENPEAHKLIQANLKALLQVWPTPVPPTAPVKSPDQVAEWIKAIALSTQKIAKAS